MAYSWVMNSIYNVVSLRVVPSPKLFTIYTKDIPLPHTGPHILYADDITQILGYPGRSIKMAQLRTGREIERINNFGEKWKIKTNINKFTVLKIAARKLEQIITASNYICDTKFQGKNLGLNKETKKKKTLPPIL